MSSTSYCVALSVNIDQGNDREVKRWRKCFRHPDGSLATVAEIRATCAEWRANGYECFPPCDRANEKGVCMGHEVKDE